VAVGVADGVVPNKVGFSVLGVVVPPPADEFAALEDGKLNAGAFALVADCGALP